jgi:outer membrane murein-binding lipoprotein Lpp
MKYVLIIIAILVAVTMYACCVAAGKADKKINELEEKK